MKRLPNPRKGREPFLFLRQSRHSKPLFLILRVNVYHRCLNRGVTHEALHRDDICSAAQEPGCERVACFIDSLSVLIVADQETVALPKHTLG